MRLFIASVTLVGLFALSAHAETFTGTATSTITNAVMATAGDGKAVNATFLNFSGQSQYSGGKATTNKGSCANWTAGPGQIFDTLGVCNYTDTNGDTATILVGCDPTNKARTELDCWGGLQGTAGPHAGKTGTITWHVKAGQDGKSGTSVSTGQWND